MNCDTKNYLIILILFLLIDVPMIFFINTDMYMEQFRRINNGPMNIGMNTLIGSIVAYILLATGLYLFVIKPSDTKNVCIKTATIKGAIFGLVLYGVYDYTNLATINDFGFYEAFVDTLWGTVLCALITYIYFQIKLYY